MSEAYIKAGEWITCEDGHRYARALHDIFKGDAIVSSDWELEDGSHPSKGEQISLCHCGKHRMRGVGKPFIEGRGWAS